MAQVFFLVSLIIAIIVLVLGIKINNTKHELTRTIQWLYFTAVACIMINAIEVIYVGKTVSLFLHGLYLAVTDWLVLILWSYIRRYTKQDFGRILIKLFCVIAVLDNISLLVNTYTEHMFDNSLREIYGSQMYVANMKFPMYASHMATAYIPSFIVLVMSGVKLLKTVKMYRAKYRAVFVSLLLILGANVGYRFMEISIDISPLFYACMAIAICYFTLYYVPRGLVVKLLSYVLKDMNNGIMCFDRQGRCVYANAEVKKLFKTGNDLTRFEKNFEIWKKGRTPEELEESSWCEEKMIDGTMNYFCTSFKLLLDENGNHVGCFFVSENHTSDVLELKKQKYRANHDKLTGIYNREGFIERAESTLEQNPNERFTILCTDIKDFKLVNELFGEKKGDEILIKIAEILKKDTTKGTIYGRLGTDRFAILMKADLYREEMYVDYARQLAELGSNDVYHMVIHVGVYQNVNRIHSIASMCDRALLAIQKIKDDYQKVVAYYDEEMSRNIRNENQMLGEFDKAIEEGQFKMFLQPQVSRDCKIQGAEALTRWIHPDKGMISPVIFIPMFERVSLIHILDAHMWEQACIKLKEWKDNGNEDLYISVNISPKDFYLIDIYSVLTNLIKKYDLNPGNLRLEITETALMADINKQMPLIEKLRAYGFIVEIDDFGSGYSSLNTLKDIKADVLKLDMGFLSKTEFQERSDAVINAVVTLSKQLGLAVVSEGVETVEQVDFLTKTGCDVFQGYYFAKPMSVENFEDKYLNEAEN